MLPASGQDCVCADSAIAPSGVVDREGVGAGGGVDVMMVPMSLTAGSRVGRTRRLSTLDL